MLAATDKPAVQVVIQDQAAFHPQGRMKTCLKDVRVLPRPPCSPGIINPVERVDDLMKDATVNRVFASME